jgi:hypothetical protein
MSELAEVRVDVDAATALVHWKSRFADEVATRARQLAAESGQSNHVTLTHYRQAAQFAIRALVGVILDGDPSSDDKAA